MGGHGRDDLAEDILEPCQGDGYSADCGVNVCSTLVTRPSVPWKQRVASVYEPSIIFFLFCFTLLFLWLW